MCASPTSFEIKHSEKRCEPDHREHIHRQWMRKLRNRFFFIERSSSSPQHSIILSIYSVLSYHDVKIAVHLESFFYIYWAILLHALKLLEALCSLVMACVQGAGTVAANTAAIMCAPLNIQTLISCCYLEFLSQLWWCFWDMDFVWKVKAKPKTFWMHQS